MTIVEPLYADLSGVRKVVEVCPSLIRGASLGYGPNVHVLRMLIEHKEHYAYIIRLF